ncbi:helix-turn-helix domain-containing protein [Nocardia transvalensis]|uniref:helix-turn-helix domain-containing protein n=1 Tax=Nocardia transvalensis TaxID=37333 RepID=UPI0018939050|nr:helix-turn-helix transcriptional regulator [Nocardia transvalensis]MBF6332306.1 helix-turn-helix transcriptional regulator [Nocardia transvalensis]
MSNTNAQSMRVARELKAAREGEKLSIRKAASRAGISESRWRQMESGVQVKNGVSSPATTTPDTLVKMARAINLDPETLLEHAGFGTSTASRRELVASVPPTMHGPRTLDLSEFTDSERAQVEAFVAGLRAGRIARAQ